MTANKSERLMNLVILLLVSRNFVTRDNIRESIDGYKGSSEDAFDKMFERDKDELRAMGVPIELGYLDAYFEDEQGYRIKRDAFELPELDLGPDEVAVLGLAARVWQHAGLASATTSALVTLKAAGVEVDRAAIDVVQPQLVAQEASFDRMWQATLSHTAVTFDYKRPGAGEITQRRLEPWGVVTHKDRWYVVGRDMDREEPRMFRLSRIQGDVTLLGKPGSFQVPEGTDVRALSASLGTAPPSADGIVLARAGAAEGIRRRATSIKRGARTTGEVIWDRLTVPYASASQLVDMVLPHGDAVLIEEPAEAVAELTARLSALSQAGGAA